MKRIPKATYQTADQIDARTKDREAEAAALPPGPERRSVLIEVARLRLYADAKRWLDAR